MHLPYHPINSGRALSFSVASFKINYGRLAPAVWKRVAALDRPISRRGIQLHTNIRDRILTSNWMDLGRTQHYKYMLSIDNR